jgi:patatin-related protein
MNQMKQITSPSQYSQEIRFAVVMYGGVSLAVYMNGIAQEMLRLVRSTSVDPMNLTGTEKIYRELACLLHPGRKPGGSSTLVSDLPHTRFVIDVLSGTSAGGINAIFLAKALAQRSKNLDSLRKLWVEKADLDTLLNDNQSEEGGRFPVSTPKKSLLNSRRMYGMLLDAFKQMDHPEETEASGNEYSEHIDLYITTTDLNGLVIPIELTDKPLLERDHRSVFHFAYDYDEGLNEFEAKYNAMLAFAARCTSSFPGAFEPMQFDNIEPKLTKEEEELFEHFFKTYTAPGKENTGAKEELGFRQRIFADGGYLDNRPFGYVIDKIGNRTSYYTTFRKLLFIDPFPEHLDQRIVCTEFNFAENAMLATSTLPRYETIRQDLARINDGNRRAIRVAEIEKALYSLDPTGAKLVPMQMNLGSKYGKMYMNELLENFGPLFVSDQLIKVSTVSDWLALVATRHLGLNESGDYYRVVRLIVSAWRRDTFSAFRPHDNPTAKQSETEFIRLYDFAFRLSRLRYLIYMIDRVVICQDNEFLNFWKGLDCHDLTPILKQNFLAELARIRCRQSILLTSLYKEKAHIEARTRTWSSDKELASIREIIGRLDRYSL